MKDEVSPKHSLITANLQLAKKEDVSWKPPKAKEVLQFLMQKEYSKKFIYKPLA